MLCVAALTTVVFQRLRQPVVIGYLLAGLLVGPHVPGPLFVSLERVQTLSQLGVIVLLFSIGLEFSVRRLLRLGPSAGVTATVVTDADGSTLQISGTSAFNISDSSTLLDDIGVAKDPLVIERNSNTVSDLFDGVTLSLFQAEAGTTISIDVEQDLSAAKTGIVNFVNAYNALRQELNRVGRVAVCRDGAAGAIVGIETILRWSDACPGSCVDGRLVRTRAPQSQDANPCRRIRL